MWAVLTILIAALLVALNLSGMIRPNAEHDRRSSEPELPTPWGWVGSCYTPRMAVTRQKRSVSETQRGLEFEFLEFGGRIYRLTLCASSEQRPVIDRPAAVPTPWGW